MERLKPSRPCPGNSPGALSTLLGVDEVALPHTAPFAVCGNLRLVCLPPCSPERRPAEIWPAHVDEPNGNRQFDNSAEPDAVVEKHNSARGNARTLAGSRTA